MSPEKQRAFDAIEAIVKHFSTLVDLYDDGRADSCGHVDPIESRAARRAHREALGGDFSNQKLAERLTSARTAAAAAGIPFEQLDQRLRAVTDIAGPVCSAHRGEYDETLCNRLQYELNQLIGLRDFYALDAKQDAVPTGGGGGPPDPLEGRPLRPLGRVDAFLAEVRSVEAGWFAELLRKEQGFVVGTSPWVGQTALLDEIKARHGFSTDHPLVRSVTALLREQEQIDAQRIAEMRERNWPPADAECREFHVRQSWFDFCDANCRGRNIPRQCMNAEEIRTPAELWAFIQSPCLSVRWVLDRRSRERPSMCPADVEGVYAAMHRLGLDAPRPPFPHFTEVEAAIELTRIANDLERADGERYDSALADETTRTRPLPTASDTGGIAADGTCTGATYNPCETEPRTFRELVTWAAFHAAAARSDWRGGTPVIANNDDNHYLECYCVDAFGSMGMESLRKLRARYIAQTGKTVDQVDATTLGEMADHFRGLMIQSYQRPKAEAATTPLGPAVRDEGGADQPAPLPAVEPSGKPDNGKQAGQHAEAQTVELTAVERALMIYARDPNQSVRSVARQVRCDHTLLLRDERFKRMREAYAGSLPSGNKSKSGDMEAEDE